MSASHWKSALGVALLLGVVVPQAASAGPIVTFTAPVVDGIDMLRVEWSGFDLGVLVGSGSFAGHLPSSSGSVTTPRTYMPPSVAPTQIYFSGTWDAAGMSDVSWSGTSFFTEPGTSIVTTYIAGLGSIRDGVGFLSLGLNADGWSGSPHDLYVPANFCEVGHCASETGELQPVLLNGFNPPEVTIQLQTQPVPEPASLFLMASGAALLAARRRLTSGRMQPRRSTTANDQ